MTELSRLLDTSEDDLERALLGAVLAESPSPAGLHDTALALGLTASAATTLVALVPEAVASLGASSPTVAVPIGASGAAAAAAPGVVSVTGVASLATLGKSLVGGALVSFFALSTAELTIAALTPVPPAVVTVSRPNAAPLPPPRPLAHAPVGAEVAPSEEPAPVAAEPSVRRLPSRPSGHPSAAPAVAPTGSHHPLEAAPPVPAPAASAPSAASLAAETRLLDRARGALAAGDSATAGQLLRQYHSHSPSGVLAREAALLQVRLLLATGQRRAASEQARRIISLYPKDAHASSLRNLAQEP